MQTFCTALCETKLGRFQANAETVSKGTQNDDYKCIKASNRAHTRLQSQIVSNNYTYIRVRKMTLWSEDQIGVPKQNKCYDKKYRRII